MKFVTHEVMLFFVEIKFIPRTVIMVACPEVIILAVAVNYLENVYHKN